MITDFKIGDKVVDKAGIEYVIISGELDCDGDVILEHYGRDSIEPRVWRKPDELEFVKDSIKWDDLLPLDDTYVPRVGDVCALCNATDELLYLQVLITDGMSWCQYVFTGDSNNVHNAELLELTSEVRYIHNIFDIYNNIDIVK